MNVKLGQLDLFGPLCKTCEKTRLCYPTGPKRTSDSCYARADPGSVRIMVNYRVLRVCVYYYKMLRNNTDNWAINLYKENNSQAILSRKGARTNFEGPLIKRLL